MNPLQFALQIKHELETVTWSGGSANLVFGAQGSVLVYAGALAEDELPTAFPFACVTIDQGEADPDTPSLLTQRFSVIVVAECAGDAMGEFAIIGGARPDLGKSAGAGVAEVSERVRYALQAMTGYDGAQIQLSAASTAAPRALGRGKHLAYDEFGLLAVCTSQPTYAAPQQLKKTGTTWTWVGAQCSNRFDFLQYRLGYKAGLSPPESPDDADGIVYTGTAATTTHTDPGARTYAIFADYDGRGTGSPEASSSGSEVGAYL